MNNLIYILVSTFLLSLISFIGSFTLIFKEKTLNKFLLIFIAFSAGTLMGGAFFHLLPEALESSIDVTLIFLLLIGGFCLFFLLEQFLHWHHCEHKDCEKSKPVGKLILFSDGLHNFLDGVVIASAFIVDTSLGIVTTLIIALHEIPQEIGDLGILIYGGYKKTKALIFNFISGLSGVLGGILGYFLSETIGKSIIYILPFAAGSFIYISASDLIPEIKHHNNIKRALIHFIIFILGLSLMFIIKN